MKNFFIMLIAAVLLLFIVPCSAYAGPLDAASEEQSRSEVNFSITSGVNLTKKVQSTFDSSRTISGVADQGTEIAISVSTKDASGELQESANYDMEVGASQLFSQTVELSLGDNFIEIIASKDGFETVTESTIIKRKKEEIKTELENSISVPGSSKTTLIITK